MIRSSIMIVVATWGMFASAGTQTNLLMKGQRADRNRLPPESWQRTKAARQYLADSQNTDGSWGDAKSRDRETPLALIGFTNHDVPGHYESNIVHGVEWLLKSGATADPDLIAIRIIAATELIDDGKWREPGQLTAFIVQQMKSLGAQPSAEWTDLLSIAHLPKTASRPATIPVASITRAKWLHKTLEPSDLSDEADLRVFILKTFESGRWSEKNSRIATTAAANLWRKQLPDGSFPGLPGQYGKAGASGLMFLQNKTWMHGSYRYFGEDKQEGREQKTNQDVEPPAGAD